MDETPVHVIVDCTTGIKTEILLTAEEIAAQAQAQADAVAKAQADSEAKAAADAAAAASLAATNAKLLNMGLTQEDIDNLLNAAKA